MAFARGGGMNNFEMIKHFNFDEMLRFVFLRTHCIDCPMKYSKQCNEEVNKCREKTKQWLLQESDHEPKYTKLEHITFFIFLFFLDLGIASFIEKIIKVFG